MKITQYLNTTAKKVKSKTYNIFIGISIGNKYFEDPNNIKDYILWAVENTKEKVCVLIPDKINAINYEVRSHYSHKSALKRALKKGSETKQTIETILGTLKPVDKNNIYILRWSDIETNPMYIKRRAALYEEFENNLIFHQQITNIVKQNINPMIVSLSEADYEKLTAYPLDELAVLIAGFEHHGSTFNLIPYPGISEIDHLNIAIQNGISFPQLTEKLQITNKVALIEGYAS